mmetsp:Transcript_14931/g.30685  ORF Transcript_14931/g.30685 Transcript_14931/m.30685 type:complete len:209 (+) Transcript_14931:1560-2186(+)
MHSVPRALCRRTPEVTLLASTTHASPKSPMHTSGGSSHELGSLAAMHAPAALSFVFSCAGSRRSRILSHLRSRCTIPRSASPHSAVTTPRKSRKQHCTRPTDACPCFMRQSLRLQEHCSITSQNSCRCDEKPKSRRRGETKRRVLPSLERGAVIKQVVSFLMLLKIIAATSSKIRLTPPRQTLIATRVGPPRAAAPGHATDTTLPKLP